MTPTTDERLDEERRQLRAEKSDVFEQLEREKFLHEQDHALAEKLGAENERLAEECQKLSHALADNVNEFERYRKDADEFTQRLQDQINELEEKIEGMEYSEKRG